MLFGNEHHLYQQGVIERVPNATLADVASWLIQKDTHESITISMQGR